VQLLQGLFSVSYSQECHASAVEQLENDPAVDILICMQHASGFDLVNY